MVRFTMKIEISTGYTKTLFTTSHIEYGEKDNYGLLLAYVNNDFLTVKYMLDDPYFHFEIFDIEDKDELTEHSPNNEDDDFFDGFPEPRLIPPETRRGSEWFNEL